MKKLVLVIIIIVICMNGYSQGRNITIDSKKVKEPVTICGEVLKVGDTIKVLTGKGNGGEFLWVQLINNFGEPIKLANSRAALRKDVIKYFRYDEDAESYAVFTEYFCIRYCLAKEQQEVKLINSSN